MSQKGLELAVEKLKRTLAVVQQVEADAKARMEEKREAYYHGQVVAYGDAIRIVEEMFPDTDAYEFGGF